MCAINLSKILFCPQSSLRITRLEADGNLDRGLQLFHWTEKYILADIEETKVQSGCLIRGRNYIHWVHPRFLVGSADLLSGLCCVVYLLFVCLRPVSSAPNVASVSVLSIHDCPFGLLTLCDSNWLRRCPEKE